mgnify:CR=1 FL=1
MVSNGKSNLVEEYRLYLERFDSKIGPCEFGAYAKHEGKLIKKLRYDEFEPKWTEFQDVDRVFSEIMQRGDTINDALVRILRDGCAEFLLERKL